MNKKIIAISLLVIVAAISISGCLGPNEDELYNEKMTEIYNDLQAMNDTMKESETAQTVSNSADSNSINIITEAIDNVTLVIDNDTQKLNELNESITNTTRKEYIKICIDELTELKKLMNITKEAMLIIKDYNDEKITIIELQTKTSKLEPQMKKFVEEGDELDKKRLDYEKKYPCVLINGTQSAFGNDTLTLNSTS